MISVLGYFFPNFSIPSFHSISFLSFSSLVDNKQIEIWCIFYCALKFLDRIDLAFMLLQLLLTHTQKKLHLLRGGLTSSCKIFMYFVMLLLQKYANYDLSPWTLRKKLLKRKLEQTAAKFIWHENPISKILITVSYFYFICSYTEKLDPILAFSSQVSSATVLGLKFMKKTFKRKWYNLVFGYWKRLELI